MFVLSFSLKKIKQRTVFVAFLLIFTVITSGLFSAVARLYRRNEMTESANADPLRKIIIIDPGHGGADSGAVGVDGVLEKDLNLQMAFEVGKLLENEGFLVVYTRNEDKLLLGQGEDIKGIRKISDLKNRKNIAESYPDSIFVSLHMNSFGESKYSGLQVYYSEQSEGSATLANSVQNKVRELVQPQNTRKVKKGESIYLLENIKGDAILIECGFLTNEEECKKLSEKEYQNQLSFAIVCGIIEYVESK